jgi:tetratricopeptide (TPR) repeat protein
MFMLEDSIKTFTDRREAIALFELLRKREPDQPFWPLLPILSFIAPSGSGKSTLIEYLIAGRCRKDGQPVLPYAYIDFTEAVALRDLLSILVELRNQLQGHQDEQGKRLTFPRFDLGAAVAIKTPLGYQLPHPDKDAVRKSLKPALSVFRSINEMGLALGNIYPYIPPLLVGVQWAKQLAWQIQPLQDLLSLIAHNSGWRWYCTQDAGIGLGTQAEIREVLLRLCALSTSSRSGKEGRDYLVNHVLPAAFLADLLDSLDGSLCPRTWNSNKNIVLFLDGFEVLMGHSNPLGIQLLELLACSKHRKSEKTDPLLLIIGSQQRILELIKEEQQLAQNPPFEQQTYIGDVLSAKEAALEQYAFWKQQLPKDLRYLRLSDFYLPFWLHDFGLQDSHDYLELINNQEQTVVFADEALVKAIHQATHGHPLYLALATAAVLEAGARGQKLMLDEFERAPMPQVWDLAPGHEDEHIGDYLLHLFLRQLPQNEQNDIISCAAPRFLNPGVLRAVLSLPTDKEAEERCKHYRRFAFTRVIDNNRFVLHPLVRKLLLKQLKPSQEQTSDYYRTHSNLWDYFNELASKHVSESSPSTEIMQIQLEEVYHSLALGIADSAIVLATAALRGNHAIWEAVLEVIAQAPIGLMPQDTESFANIALSQAREKSDPLYAIVSIVLYTWLLTASSNDTYKAACIQRNLGNTYSHLFQGNRQVSLRAAIACYEASLSVFNYASFPADWGGIKNNIGIAYQNLPGINRQANLSTAISYYNEALQVYTQESYPAGWAMVQSNLGTAYYDLLEGDKQANLEKAIACYEVALQIRTREALPVEWATTQNNLGNAYRVLPKGDTQANLEKAIACYEAALQIRTREALPVEWATTQNNLGNAYQVLPKEDTQANLEKAIACYEAALQVYTQESYPADWAMTQNNLGGVYYKLQEGDTQANLEKAIACYETALQIRTREALPVEWATTQNNLGSAYCQLTEENQQVNLEKAILYHKRALEIFSHDSFPYQWAATQNNLGLAYSKLLEGDDQSNLKNAIECYEMALQIYTPDTFPQEWVGVQTHLGDAYSSLLGDQKNGLKRAIECYEAILRLLPQETPSALQTTIQDKVRIIIQQSTKDKQAKQ